MTVKKLVALLAGLCLVTAVMTVFVLKQRGEQAPAGAPPTAATSAPSSSGPVVTGRADYLYFTETHLFVMHGDQVITRLRRFFGGGDALRNRVVWTNSGDYIALFSDANLLPGSNEQAELIAINARTGEQRRHPCGFCYDITTTGPDSVLLNVGLTGSVGDRFQTVDLRTGERKDDTRFPPALDSPNSRAFLVSTRRRVITMQYNGKGKVVLVLAESGAAAKQFGTHSSNYYTPVAPYENGDGEKYALAVAESDGCGGRSAVRILDVNGKATNTDTSAMMPPGAGSGFRVTDLWWTPKGELRATANSWTCTDLKPNNNGTHVLHSAGDLWALENGKWVKGGMDAVTMVRDLGNGTTAALTVPSCLGQTDPNANCTTGLLVLQRDGKRTVVAEKAMFLSTPPISVPAPQPITSSVVAAAPPASFAGTWSQHAGGLTIAPDGLVTMSYQSTVTVMPTFPELTMRITEVTGDRATATVLTSNDTAMPNGASVVFERKFPGLMMSGPSGLTLRWCDATNRAKGECGA
ncbi:hypothetical protein AB0E59_10440 [Lentzea sp. NPDC034063]|uniref:hypothetical protein n=1 Tax=unclassified Lentzea TaxID=2643253 RepID=UPI0033F41EA1